MTELTLKNVPKINKERRNKMENNNNEKTKLNLPVLKNKSGEISVKSENKQLKTFDIKSMQKQSKIESVLKKESIKQEMHKQQQLHAGLDLVLMGDLTGSMCEYREILRRKFKELCSILFKIIPNLRIGIIFYLDHGDSYVVKSHKLSVDIQSLANFIDSTPIGNGFDIDEAVEDALYEALNLNWSEDNTRSIVLFGDARPHEPHECEKNYDYFSITESLYKRRTTINTVYCSTATDYRKLTSLYKVEIGDFCNRISRLDHPEFFSWIANVTGGVAIGVEQIDDIVDIIKAMAAKDAGKFEELEKEVRKITAKPIPALEHIKKRAKEIESKKKVLQIDYK